MRLPRAPLGRRPVRRRRRPAARHPASRARSRRHRPRARGHAHPPGAAPGPGAAMSLAELDAFDDPTTVDQDPGWVDEIEVERLLAGDTTIPLYRGVKLTREVIETIRRL